MWWTEWHREREYLIPNSTSVVQDKVCSVGNFSKKLVPVKSLEIMIWKISRVYFKDKILSLFYLWTMDHSILLYCRAFRPWPLLLELKYWLFILLLSILSTYIMLQLPLKNIPKMQDFFSKSVRKRKFVQWSNPTSFSCRPRLRGSRSGCTSSTTRRRRCSRSSSKPGSSLTTSSPRTERPPRSPDISFTTPLGFSCFTFSSWPRRTSCSKLWWRSTRICTRERYLGSKDLATFRTEKEVRKTHGC